jgi:protein-tyrosine phosphatase
MNETPVPFPNSYWVLPNQFLAGEYPGDASNTAAIARLSALLSAGVRTVLDLTEEGEINEDAKPVPTYWHLLRDLAAEQRLEVTYLRIPIPDRGIPSVWTMRRILDVIDRSLEDENPVYVHCWAGRGRTGAVVGCHLQRSGNATERDVLLKLAALRHRMPIGHETSPHTPEQIRMVRNWKSRA